jgi:hypothetical protein
MTPSNQTYRARVCSYAALSTFVVTLAGMLLLAPPLLTQQPGVVPSMPPHPLPQIVNPESSQRTPKQQQQILKAKHKKLKQEAQELTELAKSLQQDIDRSDADVLPAPIIKKASKIENLAKKIKRGAVQ